MLTKLYKFNALVAGIMAATSLNVVAITGDFRTESDLPYCCAAGGPLVYQNIGVTIDGSVELNGTNFLENPSGWGGGVVFMDLDPTTGLLTLSSQDTWDFERFVASISNITGATVTDIQLVSGNITDRGITPSLSFTGDSIRIVYDDGSIFNFTGTSAIFQLLFGPTYTLSDASPSILATAKALEAVLSSSNLIINGAHSRPMSRRVGSGENTLWVAGDWGRDDHGARDGTLGLAEIGVGRNFGPAQVNVSFGKTWAKQDMIYNGSVDADGKYLMVEGIIPVIEKRGIYATLGAYRNWGESDIHRGYLVSSTVEYSSASPDTSTWGARARIDWENAISVKSMRFSPYADLSYTNSKVDAYTEVGGTYPAQFDSRDESVTEIRVGANAAMPIKASGFDFVANLEAAHRFDGRGDNTSGEILGMFTFNLQGDKYDTEWIKAGLGVEGKLGGGKLTVMLNGTTAGSTPSTWVAASYQKTF